jgi:ribosomal protein S18 acetylase RimI-like enzyme
MTSEIIQLDSGRMDAAAATLAAAFDADPIYSAVFPSAADRQRYLMPFWRGVVRTALLHHAVYTADDAAGVAAWLPPGHPTITLMDNLKTGFALQRSVVAFPGPARKRFLEFVDYVDPIHKELMAGRRHWYLWVLGFRPDRQGQGLGGKLIAPVLARADQNGLPCYLETETESNVAFYRRQGFEVAREGTVMDGTLRLWMMVREPAPAS